MQVSRLWKRQAPRLLHLCCRLVCCIGGDALVDAAAIRLLGIMTDAKQWKVGGEAAQGAAAELRSVFVREPGPLLAALGRLLQAAASPAAGAAPAASGPTALVSASPSALLLKLQSLVALVLQQGSSSNSSSGPNNILALFSRMALISSGGCDQLSEEIKVREVMMRWWLFVI